MTAQRICVATHKGGTGKTVTAISLAAAIAKTGKRVLLLDLDPQGHSTSGLGVDAGHDEPSIRDLFTDPPRHAKELVRKTGVSGLDIVPSNIRLAPVAQSLYGRMKREELLKRRLDPLLAEYDFLVMDCPPSLGVLTDNALTAADFVLIPCQMEARAADGLLDLLTAIRELKGEEFRDWRILRTRFDARKSVTNDAVLAALEPWKDRILETVIPTNEALNQAQMARVSIYEFQPSSSGALAYQALAEEFLKVISS
jgi:chromosome partitioning protein